jgi:hypothetical protein
MGARLEAFLARIYSDAAARTAFLADPAGEARRAGLDDAEQRAVIGIDRAGLDLAADSFARKRAGRHRHGL